MYATHCSANCKALSQTVFSHASSELWRQAQTAQQRLNDYIQSMITLQDYVTSYSIRQVINVEVGNKACRDSR